MNNNEDILTLSRVPYSKECFDSEQFKKSLPIVLSKDYKEDDKDKYQVVYFIDTETTGLSAKNNEIIELAVIKARATSLGEVMVIEDVFKEYQQPKIPISEEITSITGITNDMVKGKVIREKDFLDFTKESGVFIAHNALFDRKFVEARFKWIKESAWLCTKNDIKWSQYGFTRDNLEFLLFKCGYFYDAHSALVDCMALLWLLKINKEAFTYLLETKERKYYRIIATGMPFEKKDEIKTKGYYWNDGSLWQPRGWYKKVEEKEIKAQKKYLKSLYDNGDKLCTIQLIENK